MAFPQRTSRRLLACGIILLGIFAIFAQRENAVRAADKGATAAKGWNARAAAQYLDSREAWWQSWDHARRDHQTHCVSCHTQAPFALARPMLRRSLGEAAISPAEKAMLADIEKRVRNWDAMLPFYSDEKYGQGKEIESRNAEAVLNAFILAGYDEGRDELTGLARLAFDHAWALQSRTGPDAGAWVWQDFDYTPWESKESQYHWAALMAVAVGRAPGKYRQDPGVAKNLALLQGYLRAHYDAQPLLNKIAALWASAFLPGLMSQPRRNALAVEIRKLQHSDGGWSLTDLGTWERRDKTPLDTRSDGYATGLIVLALEETGTAERPGTGGATSPVATDGLGWLAANQDQQTGSWKARSLNKDRDPNSDAGLFMTDAATGYAVLALENLRR